MKPAIYVCGSYRIAQIISINERKGEISMATVGGLTNSTSNSLRGYGGLASGMDRDTLIEGMTYGTTSKITQQ